MSRSSRILIFYKQDLQIILLFIQIYPKPEHKVEPGQEWLRGGGGDGGHGQRAKRQGPPAETRRDQSGVN